jgi:hypothetical protein
MAFFAPSSTHLLNFENTTIKIPGGGLGRENSISKEDQKKTKRRPKENKMIKCFRKAVKIRANRAK